MNISPEIGFLCTLDGSHVQVVHAKQFHARNGLKSLSSLFDGAQFGRLKEFLELVRAEGVAYDWDFKTHSSRTRHWHLIAYRDGDIIAIAGAAAASCLPRICAELAEQNRSFLGNLLYAMAAKVSFTSHSGQTKKNNGREHESVALVNSHLPYSRRESGSGREPGKSALCGGPTTGAGLDHVLQLLQIGTWEW